MKKGGVAYTNVKLLYFLFIWSEIILKIGRARELETEYLFYVA